VRPAEAAGHVVRALGGGPPVAEVVVVRSEAQELTPGARMLVWKETAAGSLGADEVDREVTLAAREALVSRKPFTLTVEIGGGAASVFIEPHFPPDELVIVGAGHIARPLCRLGAMVGFRVVVLDDRPGFATRERFPEAERLVKADFADTFRDVPLGRGTHLVLVTRGHKYDYEALRDVLLREIDLGYIGMVGSQRRVRAAMEQLAREGIARERLEAVYAPIGLDIRAETPEEIAVSIVGELIRLRRGGTGESLRDRSRVMQRWIK
jgi:xanthine dehydrogenase accessory factor